MLHDSLQPLLAPVVLISACGLTIMALNARAMSSKSRIRQLHHERLEICEKANQTGGATATQHLRYEGVGAQSTNILFRLRLIRAALMCMVGCVALMLISSLLIGIHSFIQYSPVPAFTVFILGMLSMLSGAVIFLAELKLSLKEVAYEHDRMMRLELPMKKGEEGQ